MTARFTDINKTRRRLASMFVLLASTGFAFDSMAQAYPARPITIVVPNPPGGVADLAARMIAPKLSEALGQQVLVENRPGGSGSIALGLVSRAKPDGYTLLMGTIADLSIHPLLMPTVPYDTQKDFAPIVSVSSTALTIAVHPSVTANNLRELVAQAKADPKKFAYASSGNGTINQVVGEWFAHDAGIEMNHIPYKGGGPAAQDVIAGHVPVGIIAVSAAKPNVTAGRLKVLGVSTAKRLPFEPNWPTIAESGFPNLSASLWVGLLAPANVPKEIVVKLNAEVNTILKSAEVRNKFHAQGADVLGGTPEDLVSTIRSDRERYGRMLKDYNIRID
ncbi:MAG: bordetella uptake protein [Devosia sp.]|nr:bordetella uptake protein [Devosia sp.]